MSLSSLSNTNEKRNTCRSLNPPNTKRKRWHKFQPRLHPRATSIFCNPPTPPQKIYTSDTNQKTKSISPQHQLSQHPKAKILSPFDPQTSQPPCLLPLLFSTHLLQGGHIGGTVPMEMTSVSVASGDRITPLVAKPWSKRPFWKGSHNPTSMEFPGSLNRWDR